MGLLTTVSLLQASQFAPETYGARGDGVTNDTAAVKSAVNAAVAYAQAHNGYAEVVFSPLTYLLSGALTQGGATKGNSQIPLPVIDPLVGQKITLVFRGTRDASAVPHWAQTVTQLSGAVLRSTLTTGTNDGTFGTASVIGGPTSPQGYGMAGNDATFSNMLIVIDGVAVVVPSDPTLIPFDFNGVAEANVISAASLANQLPSAPVVPTHNWAMGLRMPAVNNNDNSNIGWMSVEGFYYAYVLNEHTTFQRLLAVYCIHGMYLIGAGAHECCTGLYASIEVCQAAVTIDPGAICQVSIASLDIEDGNPPFGPSWHINDTGNQGRGHIGFNRNSTGPPIVIGGAFLEILYNKSAAQALGGLTPAVPASTVAYLNPWFRHAMVNMTGGTVTAIAVDGVATGLTSGTFIVPSNKTITLTYSVAPTWNWVLL